MVEVGEVTVELVGLRIPPRQEHQLQTDATEQRKTAGYHPIDEPEGEGHHHDAESSPDDGVEIVDLRTHEETQHQCQQRIAHDDPLHCQQPLPRLLLNLEYILYTIHFSLFTSHSHPFSLYHCIVSFTPCSNFTVG